MYLKPPKMYLQANSCLGISSSAAAFSVIHLLSATPSINHCYGPPIYADEPIQST